MTSRATDIPVANLLEAARRLEIRETMRTFYAEADRRIAEHAATCWNKGRCCQFGQYGHRLYVTALEAAYYLAAGIAFESSAKENRDAPRAASAPPIADDACPHAHGGRCHARDRRPLGCRIFYCDPAAKPWQGPLTEEMLAQLRELHEELDVPYFYAEWMTVLRAIQPIAP